MASVKRIIIHTIRENDNLMADYKIFDECNQGISYMPFMDLLRLMKREDMLGTVTRDHEYMYYVKDDCQSKLLECDMTYVLSRIDYKEENDIIRNKLLAGDIKYSPDIIIDESFYYSIDWKITTKLIKKRDGMKCVQCGETRSLHVHHIITLQEDPKLMFEPDNLITLCKYHHSMQHAHMMYIVLFSPNGVNYFNPNLINTPECKYCHRYIEWKTPKEHGNQYVTTNLPYNLDGSRHRCKEYTEFKKERKKK